VKYKKYLKINMKFNDKTFFSPINYDFLGLILTKFNANFVSFY